MAGLTLEIDKGHKNKKTGFYPVFTIIFMDFMRY